MGPEVLAGLRAACGGERSRPAEVADSVAGARPAFAAEPCTEAEVASVMKVARAHHLSLVVRGRGTKLDWGAPPDSADLVLDVSGLDQLIEHAPGDLVARVGAGVRLATLRQVLASEGQWLPVDEVVPGSTLGGALATGMCGPTRMSNGTLADLLTGVSFVRADGVVARNGGKVVKNVAGYNLTRLLAGSFGTLGVVTDVTVRLRPLPESRCFVGSRFGHGAALAAPLEALHGSQLAIGALEIDRPGPDAPIELTALVEGSARGVAARAERAERLIGAGTASGEPPAGWGALPGSVTIKASCPLASVPALVDAVAAIAKAGGCAASVRGSAGTGVLFVGLDGPIEAAVVARFVSGLRGWVGAAGGSAVVLRAPGPVKAAIDPWGPVRGLELMRRVKAQFDPERRLAPGRFVGGI